MQTLETAYWSSEQKVCYGFLHPTVLPLKEALANLAVSENVICCIIFFFV